MLGKPHAKRRLRPSALGERTFFRPHRDRRPIRHRTMKRPDVRHLRSPQNVSEKESSSEGCKAGLLACSERNAFPVPRTSGKEYCAHWGTYSSGNCCRISRHSHL